MSQSPSQQELREDRFSRLVAVLIATIIVMGAIVGLLEVHAGAKSETADREAQRLQIQASGQESQGRIRAGYDWQTAYQMWTELDLLRQSADQDYGDSLAAARYKSVRDATAGLSEFLTNKELFNPDSQVTNFSGYEADTYLVHAKELAERRLVQSEVHSEWHKRAQSHIIQLTLLASALFLFGLAATVRGLGRRLFVAVGGAIAATAVIWALVVFARPLPGRPDEAVTAYANGFGLAYQDKNQDAIDSFGKALELDSGYANAYQGRGNARSSLGAEMQQDGNTDEAAVLFTQATEDYELARAAGRKDTSVGWNLGWTYYLNGRLDDAIKTDREVLKQDPSLVGVRTNLALALLAGGDADGARTAYEEAAQQLEDSAQERNAALAAGTEASPLFWSQLVYAAIGARDLESLLDSLAGRHAWTETPAPASVNADAVETEGPALLARLRNVTLALEETGQPPPDGEVTAQITCFGFGSPVFDDQGKIIGHTNESSFPYNTKQVIVGLGYAGITKGQSIVFRVYRNGVELPSLRIRYKWTLDESGSAFDQGISYAYSNRFVLADGHYDVEMYVDYNLVQSGSFTILNDAGTADTGGGEFADDFSDPHSGWDCNRNDRVITDYEDGGYRILVSEAGSLWWATPGRYFGDASIEVDARKTAGPDANDYGVICRSGANRDFYSFIVTADGYAGIGLTQGDQSRLLTGGGSLLRSTAVNTGDASNHIRADCVGDKLSLSVNGVNVLTAQDSTLTYGDVGLFAGTYDKPGTDVLFDDFTASPR